MNWLEIVLVSISLAADAFAVSVSGGSTMKRFHVKNAFKMAVFFGGFQAIMPVAGWLAGLSIVTHIDEIDHWVAFFLLAGIGAKMIYESVKLDECGKSGNGKKTCPFNTDILLILSLATSMDALVVGVTFSMMKISIIAPVLAIGTITFAMTLAGVKIGHEGKHFFENKMEMAAGIILILLGFKILLKHVL